MSDEALVHNYIVERGLAANLPQKIVIWDETLRDGEQTPGVAFTPEEKVSIATLLDDMGVPLMDVGIPVVSKEEARGVKLIANAGLDASIMAAARAVRKDVEACVECGVDEIAIFIACSDLHLKYKLNMTREQVKEAAVRETEYAKDHGLRVSFVTEDTFRADLDYVVDLYNACIQAGASRAVICDTVGVMTPIGIRWFVEQVTARLPRIQLSFHGHNDFGLAVANSLAAVEAGAEQGPVTGNGIGERAGNAALEEVAMALLVRRDVEPYHTEIHTEELYPASQMLIRLTGMIVQRNKAIVGRNAFAHEAGIHQDGVLKHAITYEIMSPEAVGMPSNHIVLGKHSGRHALAKLY